MVKAQPKTKLLSVRDLIKNDGDNPVTITAELPWQLKSLLVSIYAVLAHKVSRKSWVYSISVAMRTHH